MTPEQLVAWLRDEDDGMKTPCLEAADLIESLSSKLDERTTQLREIVAWFDVMHSKYVVDGTPVELSEEWPSDWMRRARNVLQSSENSSHD